MNRRILKFILAFSFAINLESNAQWRASTPYNGDINDIVFTNELTGFAATQASGVGSCSGTTSIMRTIDGGKNWIRMNTGSTYAMNKLHFMDSFTGYALGAGSAILKTTDGGQSWTNLTSGIGSGLNDIHFAPGSNTGFVVGPSGALRKTTNGGSNWTTIASGVTGTLFSVHFLDANTGFIAGANGVVRKTTNGGSSWTSIFSGTDYIKDVWFADAQNGFILSPYKIFRTTNGGASWTSWDANADYILHRFNFLNAQEGYATADPRTLLRTFDGGITWQTYQLPYPNLSFETAFFLNSNVAYLASAGGRISKTTDGGLTWDNQTSGFATTQLGIDFIDPQNGVFVGGSGEIYYTRNGALNMRRAKYEGNRYCTGVKYLRPNLALVSADSGIILRSVDAGVSWTNIQTSAQESFTDIMAVDTNCAYVCGSNGAVFKTLNGGLSWTNVSINTTTSLQGVYFTTRNIGLAVGGNQIYKTSNGGLSWALKNNGVDVNTSFNDVWMIDADIAFVGGTFGKLYKTFDGANFWNPIYPASGSNAGIEEMDWQTDSIGYFATNSSQSITLNGGSVLGTLSTACLANNGGMDAICIPQDGYGYSTGGLSRVLHTVKPQGIISAYLQDSAFCSGSRIFVGYGAEGLLISTHVMSVQLSNASGNFSSPTTIGTYTLGFPSTNPSGIITCTLPAGINGQGYRVRVVCDNPALVGPDNGFDIRIGTTLTPSAQILTDANPVCAGESATLTAAGSALGLSPEFTWLVGGNPIANTSASIELNSISFNTQISLAVQSSLSCVSSASANANVLLEIAASPIIEAGFDAEICSGQSVQLGTPGALNYTWNPATGLDNANAAQPNASPIESTTYTLTATNAAGCAASDVVSVAVQSTPEPPVIELLGAELIVNNPIAGTYTWFLNGEELIGEENPQLSIGAFGVYAASVSLNGCSSELSQGYEVISVGATDEMENKLRVFTDAHGNLRIEQINEEIQSIGLFDLSGRMVLNVNQATGSNNALTLNTANLLPSGIYIVRLQGQQSTNVFKIVLGQR
jgi:photosystem II stability/assembly factor-like uncharacterized protein